MFYVAICVAKLVNLLIQKLHLGAGFTWPGYIALKLCPSFLASQNIFFPKGIVLVSGTNGKTTTTKLITHLLENSGLTVTHNRTGANLEHGVLTSLVLDMDIFGKLHTDVGVFEVDEFALPNLLEKIKPSTLVLLNLSRDQLDRYWELDIILDKWKVVLNTLDSTTQLLLDADQQHFAELVPSFSGNTSFFDGNNALLKKTQLYGEFNARNVNASVKVCEFLGLEQESVFSSLSTFEAAYGRGERVWYRDKPFQIFLAKNPASFNHNLDVINEGLLDVDTLFFILNDNIPDGRDVSWIYDIATEKLALACKDKKIVVAGTRGFDMAVRLHYAGIFVSKGDVWVGISNAVSDLVENMQSGNILVLPNYSAMLEVRKILVGRQIL